MQACGVKVNVKTIICNFQVQVSDDSSEPFYFLSKEITLILPIKLTRHSMINYQSYEIDIIHIPYVFPKYLISPHILL